MKYKHIPLDPMKCILIKNGKRFNFICCYDGEDNLEIYKQKDETDWVGTIYIDSMKADYFVQKFCPVIPNVKKYKIVVPKMGFEITEIKPVKVFWE